MGNTFFYRQVKDDSTKITWKDILSECRKKHTRQDLEYALSAGTVMNRVAEADMLGKWQKPWIFYPMLKGGLLLVILTYAALFVPIFAIGSYNDGSLYLTTILPPIVIPFILMIFIWELNIPKNISVYELLIGFLAGGILSFAVVSVMFLFVGDGPGIFAASFAAFREEPAKLAAAAVMKWRISARRCRGAEWVEWKTTVPQCRAVRRKTVRHPQWKIMTGSQRRSIWEKSLGSHRRWAGWCAWRVPHGERITVSGQAIISSAERSIWISACAAAGKSAVRSIRYRNRRKLRYLCMLFD